MSATALDVTHGENFSSAHAGSLTDLHSYQFLHPLGKGRAFPGKLFLKEPLQLTGMEVSLNKLPAGQSVPFYHQHRAHEELYVFLKGRGQFQVDGTVLDVEEGSVVRVAPNGMRTWRNNSHEDLVYIVIQARADALDANDIEDGIASPERVSWPA